MLGDAQRTAFQAGDGLARIAEQLVQLLQLMTLLDQRLGMLGNALAHHFQHAGALEVAGIDMRLSAVVLVYLQQLLLDLLQFVEQLPGFLLCSLA
ncbi:hypothetical protein D3C78_1605370 [compost metagenome]